MEFKLIELTSEAYQQEVVLRNEVLLHPVGLDVQTLDPNSEDSSFHLGAFKNSDLQACLVLSPRADQQIQMRQVAVHKSLQGKGIGKKLVDFSEVFAKEKGFETMFLHARDHAVGFYKKLAYQVVGDYFEEVGIPHLKMIKQL